MSGGPLALVTPIKAQRAPLFKDEIQPVLEKNCVACRLCALARRFPTVGDGRFGGMARTAEIRRETAETKIELKLNLDGTGVADLDTGIGFLDHMLHLLTRHSLIDLSVHATGDLHVDAHH